MLEHKVLNTADTIIVTSKTTKEFEAITDKPIAVITNGYDVEKNVQKQHIGSFFQSEIR
jgi:galactitol-specific phosphotransferase system IIB component